LEGTKASVEELVRRANPAAEKRLNLRIMTVAGL
jgi:hypothetical protein